MTPIDVVKAVYATFATGDMSTWKTYMSPDLVFKVAGNLPQSGTFNGPEDVINNCFGPMAEHYPGISITPIQYWDCGDTVFVECKSFSDNLPEEGLLEIHKIIVDDEKCIFFQDYFDTEAASAALMTDSEVAKSPGNAMIVFNDISKLKDREIQTLMREVDQQDLVIALKSASDELKDKVLGNMSERVRVFIVEEMKAQGPMSLSEIEKVQLRIVQQLYQLEEQGLVAIVRSDSDESAV
jgi:ketosteroid isomerase-like protein